MADSGRAPNVLLFSVDHFEKRHNLISASFTWLQMKGLEESLVLRLLLLYEFGRGSGSAWASFIVHLAYCMNSPVCVLLKTPIFDYNVLTM